METGLPSDSGNTSRPITPSMPVTSVVMSSIFLLQTESSVRSRIRQEIYLACFKCYTWPVTYDARSLVYDLGVEKKGKNLKCCSSWAAWREEWRTSEGRGHDAR
jgi:hypothetical protein